ncbi:MinD-like ATPase involved in chromosome partitioning or flagellar assembly [Arthrobacter sp. PL16]|uniref:MinD/ParA family ATP-binding protein n=1 Tax=Arthrobacter sp. PL16 TaxID=3071720 RepID=UPI002DF8174B|nr:MinD-like ATPase involved in chromosome partitioning or flagellar assembly [Arthrobacter sp. PL16]
MASDTTDPSTAGTGGTAPGADATIPDRTQGVPIVPGVPLLPGQGRIKDADADADADGDSDRSGGAATSASAAKEGAALRPSASPATAGLTEAAEATGWTPSGSGSGRTSPTEADSNGGGLPGTAGSTAGAAAERTSRRDRELGPEPASALTAGRLLVGVDRPPVSGWRRWLYTATFGRVNVGDSDAVRVQRALEHRISARLGGRTRYVPVLSRKGGVGKTTVTTLLGMVLADVREDRIIAMDANPDRGTLSDRSPGRADHTARQLVRNRYTIDSFAQLAGYVTRDGSRLHVLASDTDPAVAQAFDDSDYRAVTDLLSRYYSIVLTDCGTGMVHSVMKGTLEKADSVVLVSGGSIDEARLASETLSWLEAHGRQDLVAKAIVVINLSSGNGTQVNISQIEQHFRSRVKTVVRIPYDRHLAEGSCVDLSRLNPATRRAVTELAALVVDQLGA